jgi:glyoxylase-like metal-dependent hydrolase (beta-lactamase superfamily II)
MRTPTVTQAADNAYLVEGTSVNWVVITDGDAVTLIDAGYPGDLYAVEESLHSIGYRPGQIAAVLITHAHIDHIGSLPRLLRHSQAPVFMTAQEVHHARGDFLESATPVGVICNLWRPGFPRWALRAARAGALKHVHLSEAQPFPHDGALDLPGHPVPIPTSGHTSGHTSYHFPEAGLIVTGDALVSAHPTSGTPGPQLLMPLFSHDQAAAIAALDVLEHLDADTVASGHGPLLRSPVRDAAAIARERAMSSAR